MQFRNRFLGNCRKVFCFWIPWMVHGPWWILGSYNRNQIHIPSHMLTIRCQDTRPQVHMHYKISNLLYRFTQIRCSNLLTVGLKFDEPSCFRQIKLSTHLYLTFQVQYQFRHTQFGYRNFSKSTFAKRRIRKGNFSPVVSLMRPRNLGHLDVNGTLAVLWHKCTMFYSLPIVFK